MKYSIATKITIIFAISFALVCIVFFTYANIQKQNSLESVRNKQISAINYLLTLYERASPPQDLEQYFRNFGLEYVSNQNLAVSIVKDGELIFAKQTPIGVVQSIMYNDNLYLHLKNTGFHLLIESSETKKVNDSLLISFVIAMVLLISLYVSVMRSLMPLRKLSVDIRRFAAGNLDVSICPASKDNFDQQDEIGQVAYEFDNAVCKIRDLIRSRQLFLRAIMHELKTPIGKGRIVSEMVANETQKSRLTSIFIRLEMLINEFSKIEQLLSKSYSLNYQECHFSLILEQVEDMLMLENFSEKVACDIKEDVVLRVDFQLFSLAIKNLIDNAIKYADDKKAILVCDNDMIAVKNLGKPLEHEMSFYLQAFVRGDKNSKSSGMGLGLYIIDQIFNMHKMGLKYSYEDGYHCFFVPLKKDFVEKS
ncbi:ArsS family sensor histidine kinase [Campylobacter mucosalis]|uniref:ArsS family sensor histidine kinase n=1 Tax=Campylobacter mucosalis TaxID=202 RepID=UPI0014702C40|nr:ArsS family sensor histidine kinase [Campylobacter mucosalis]